MSGQHTPGPWQYHCENVDPEWHVVTSATSPLRGVIANVHIAAGNARDLADARLIAAAPDLLAVVAELHESADYWSEYDVPLGIVERINAAIAKATGAAECGCRPGECESKPQGCRMTREIKEGGHQ